MVVDLEVRFEHDAECWKAPAHLTPEWFRRTKLEFFIHWGPYSAPMRGEPVAELGEIPPTEWFRHDPYAEWYHNTIRLEGSPARRHHAEMHGGCDYDDFLGAWWAERFDADAAVAELVAAGRSYVMLTTKHRDGVCLWDTSSTGDRNTMRRGSGRNLVGEWADAARCAGMRLGAYYSGGLDWHAAPTEPIGLRDDWDLTGRLLDQGYASYAAGHLWGLIARYNPDVLWNDINWPDAGKDFGSDDVGTVFEEHYVTNPEGLVNDHWQVLHQGYATSEYRHFQQCKNAAVREHCRGAGLSFEYNSVEGPEHAMPPLELMKHLVDIVQRGGRMLLGAGLRADGTLSGWQLEILRGIGHWMRVTGRWLPDLVADGELEIEGVWTRLGRAGDSCLLSIGADVPVVIPAGRLLTLEWASLEDGALTCAEDHPDPAVVKLI